MEELTPSDSISQAGSREANPFYDAAPYPGPMYSQSHAPHPQGQQYYPSYGAHVHAQGHPTYLPYLPTPPPMLSPTYPHSASRVRTRSRRISSFVSSSTPPGGLASLYAPTLSYSGSGNTLVAPSPTQYSVPASYSSRTRSYAAGAPYGEHQARLLQVPQPLLYPHPPSSYGTHSATTSPNASPQAMETRALVPYSHHSAHLPRSPRSSYSRLSSQSHLSSNSHLSPQTSPTPSAQPLPLVATLRTEHQIVVLNAPGQTVFINVTQQYHQYHQYQYYPQEAEQRKSSFLGGLTGFLGRKSQGSRRDSY